MPFRSWVGWLHCFPIMRRSCCWPRSRPARSTTLATEAETLSRSSGQAAAEAATSLPASAKPAAMPCSVAPFPWVSSVEEEVRMRLTAVRSADDVASCSSQGDARRILNTWVRTPALSSGHSTVDAGL